MPRLFLRVLSEATQLPDGEGFEIGIEWLIKETNGTVRGFGVTDYRGLGDIADPNVDWLSNPENTVVIIPSHFVLMVSCEVPGRSAGQIKRALPFAVEEFVASDIEAMHIAHAPIKPGHPVKCNIVTNEQIESWLSCLRSLGVSPGYFVADAQLLPREADVSSVLFDGETVLLADEEQAAVVDRGNLALALNTLRPSTVVCINGTLTDLELGQLESAPQVETVPVSEAGVLDYFAERFPRADYINLLQGEHQAARPPNPTARRWRGIAALAAVWILVAFVGMVVQGFWAEREADRLQTESFALYESIFPGDSQPGSVDQLRRRMALKLGQKVGGSGSAFVGLTANLANSLATDSTVASLSYNEQRRELTVEVMLSNYDELEVIKSKLEGTGIAIDVASAEEEGGRVRSRLRVRNSR